MDVPVRDVRDDEEAQVMRPDGSVDRNPRLDVTPASVRT